MEAFGFRLNRERLADNGQSLQPAGVLELHHIPPAFTLERLFQLLDALGLFRLAFEDTLCLLLRLIKSSLRADAHPVVIGVGCFLDFLCIRMNSKKAEGIEFTINLATPDNGEKFLIELSNATLTNLEGYQADDADLTITIDRADLESVMMGAKTFAAQIEDGTAKVEGKKEVLSQLGSMMVDFDLAFEIIPGTVAPREPEDLNDFETGPIYPVHE